VATSAIAPAAVPTTNFDHAGILRRNGAALGAIGAAALAGPDSPAVSTRAALKTRFFNIGKFLS
jgi:hypothetical protein